MAALALSLSQAPSPVAHVNSPPENEEQAPSVSASSSYCYVKVDFGAMPQIQNKQHIKEWEQKWQNFCNNQLPRERFVSDESWRNKMKVCFDKLENSEVNRDIQRLLDWGVLAENIPRALRKEYGLLTFKVESKIALRIQFFPYHYDKVDKDGLPVVRSGLIFSYYIIHKRLDELLRDTRHLIGGDLEDSIISRRPCEFRYEEASGGEMVCAEEVEASPLLEGVDREPVCPLLRGAFKSRHLIGGDLEDSIISRRPCEFRYEEASGGEMVCAEEVEASPLLEGVDREPVCPLLRGAFKSGMDRKLFDSSLSSPGESKGEGGQGGNINDSFSSYSSSPSLFGVSPGLGGEGRGSDEVDDGAFSDVDVEEVPCDAGDRPPAQFSSSFASARFFPSVSHTAARLCERYIATSVSSDIGGAQPFSFPLQSPAGIQIQISQAELEMHAQQEGGEEGEREEREEAERDSEPKRGARRLPKREEREDGGGVPPSSVAQDVEVD
uniref:Uncharacterized protein n=1 Tax=Chromera velia CCMP2878 TaxID=1169474 RepID=A0A0G4GBZ4_9ALVE|eukprot:Cvel_21209.t1-p1 / transcript=Cvel_21209.t1 / gene=Cvel_21209 / organism=Chromera_velia_CCMP2878 / gene_product=hypothetical protein / transcript_product=hypothetical protein / location=Cvel_scaffold1969:31569-35258(-) / protein_length=495 / sequence_SO=supercontig / SO=protein_coding / is_pseudo=false